MDVKEFIKVYDGFLKPEQISSLIKWLITQKFDVAETVGGVQKKIRSAATKNLFRDPDSLTNLHWFNFLANRFTNLVREYDLQNKYDACITKVSEMTALKYEEGDYYKVHTDNHTKFHRTLSIILYLNDDYEGGSVIFKCPRTNETMLEVPRKSGRVIIFPSNFLYPHAVQNVKKGCRYSIVSWLN